MFWKGTGNSTVSSDAPHTVQELEEAQSHDGSAGVERLEEWVLVGVR